MTLPVVFTANGPSGYNLTKSLRFRSSAGAWLNRTPATTTNRQTYTWSGWVKTSLANVNGSDMPLLTSRPAAGTYTLFQLKNSNTLQFSDSTAGGSVTTTQVFRDPSAWYHIVLAVDTTQATAANRVKMYVNGVQITAFSSTTYPAQNGNTQINVAQTQGIGRDVYDTGALFDGYLAEVNFIDGQQLTPSSFGSTNALTGVWQPAKYTGTYGNNGFYLPFTNTTSTTTLGYDFSGNSNNWTTNNLSLTAGTTYDSMTDVPTLTSATTANYAVANPLLNLGGIVNVTNGNLTATKSGNGDYIIPSTMAIPAGTGKWYWEVTATTISASSNFSLGVVNSTITTGAWGTSSPSAVFWNASGGARQAYNVPSTGTSWSVASGDVIGQALDATTGNFSLYKNGTLVETWNASVNTALSSFAFSSSYANGESYSFNFGQQGFTYTPPTGFVALNTYNLPTSTIVKGNTVMDAALYTGDGTSPKQVVSSLNFQPDFSWTKTRSASTQHALYDSVRGAGSGKILLSDTTDAEGGSGGTSDATYGYLSAFNSNGITTTKGTNATNYFFNNSGVTYVSWNWKAGQGNNTTNTSGSITSTVSVNATAGFSVVTWVLGSTDNLTIGHGLGVAPSMIIVKNRSAVAQWLVYQSSNTSAPETEYLALESTQATIDDVRAWNDTLPTSAVFTIGDVSWWGSSTDNMVAYCWSEVAGFSKFGSYTGNNSADGPFVYLGFSPKFVMIKCSTSAEPWLIIDCVRQTYDVLGPYLIPNSSDAEGTYPFIDFTSNGFKLRNTGGSFNNAGGTYIYMAFASNPFKNSNAF